MPNQSDPAKFRASATALYRRVRIWLVALIAVAGGLGFLIGGLIGHALASHGDLPDLPAGSGWLVGGLIGLATCLACTTVIAGVVWVGATLFYAMTQDGA